jgi:hypothetical protein
MDNLPDVKEALNEYFKLKNKYETQITINKNKIMNKNFLSNREKKTEYNKLKPKCINCKRPGGTIFSRVYVNETDQSESYKELRAFCGIIADPCNLNITIHLAKVELMPELLESMEKEIKKNKNDIIDDKNKLLFGYINTEDALERFESVKGYIGDLTSLYEQYLESYNNIVDNDEKKQELNEAITNFYIEIQKIKDSIIQMNDTNNVQYARDAVNIYTTTLMPLLHTIRELKYDETFVWHNEYTNTCNLMQNKYSISNLSFSSSNDKVLAFDVGLSAAPKKKRIIIESSSSASSLEPENLTPGVELEPGQIPEPIYGDGLDGVIWNVPEYDRLWANLPTAVRTALITDTEWMKDFMSNCVAARASGQPCKFTGPRNLILPPEINPDGSVNFGINVYNQAFASLDKNTQATYLTFYSEKDGVTNYNMLANAMNDLVAKMLQFGKGYF